jgi:hypothetical protein
MLHQDILLFSRNSMILKLIVVIDASEMNGVFCAFGGCRAKRDDAGARQWQLFLFHQADFRLAVHFNKRAIRAVINEHKFPFSIDESRVPSR